MLSKTAGDRHQGAIQGFGSSIGSFASIVGLIIGGVVYESAGHLTFVAPAILIGVVAVLSSRVGAKGPAPEAATEASR